MSVQPATIQKPVQGATVQTPVTIQATPVKVLPPSSILTPPPKVEAPSRRKGKRPRIRFVSYLKEDGRPLIVYYCVYIIWLELVNI